MDIRDELTPTILKMRNLADTFFCSSPERPARHDKSSSMSHLLNGLADEIESVLAAYPAQSPFEFQGVAP